MAKGFQSKTPSNTSAINPENFTAPDSPRNNAPKLASSTIKPLEKPLINPKPKALAISS